MAGPLTDAAAEAASFTAKWRGHWPEWTVAEVFVPVPQREIAVAWLALREELAEAAWGFADPRPGEAKLLWWAEELHGWRQGRRRHPLGALLQPLRAPWPALATCLPAVRAARDMPADPRAAAALLEPYAEAVAGVGQAVFDCERPAPERAVALAQLAERAVLLARTGQSDALPLADVLAEWGPIIDGSRTGRLHAAMLQTRARRLAAGQPGPVPGWRMLPVAWRAARG